MCDEWSANDEKAWEFHFNTGCDLDVGEAGEDLEKERFAKLRSVGRLG